MVAEVIEALGSDAQTIVVRRKGSRTMKCKPLSAPTFFLDAEQFGCLLDYLSTGSHSAT